MKKILLFATLLLWSKILNAQCGSVSSATICLGDSAAINIIGSSNYTITPKPKN